MYRSESRSAIARSRVWVGQMFSHVPFILQQIAGGVPSCLNLTLWTLNFKTILLTANHFKTEFVFTILNTLQSESSVRYVTCRDRDKFALFLRGLIINKIIFNSKFCLPFNIITFQFNTLTATFFPLLYLLFNILLPQPLIMSVGCRIS